MEINVALLEEQMKEFNKQADDLKKQDMKINTASLVEQLDERERKNFDTIVAQLLKLDALIHGNFNEKIALLVNEKVKTLAADSRMRNDYLQSVSKKALKLEYDEEMTAKIEALQKLRKRILSIQMMLESEDTVIPKNLLKDNGKTLALNNIPSLKEETEKKEDSKPRGRPGKERIMVLGTVDENEEVTWHDNDHIGKTFLEIFGTVRADACPPGLFNAVEKAGIENYTKSGWDTPVEYAGKLWVAKVRS